MFSNANVYKKEFCSLLSTAHFRYDNLDGIEDGSERSDPLFRIPHSEFLIEKG